MLGVRALGAERGAWARRAPHRRPPPPVPSDVAAAVAAKASTPQEESTTSTPSAAVVVEYVPAPVGGDAAAPAFAAVLAKFLGGGEDGGDGGGGDTAMADGSGSSDGGCDHDSDDPTAAGGDAATRAARKAAARAALASLKATAPRPDLVELWDATAPDPGLLVSLKAAPNTVPVPRHWSQRRAYLQGKRGLDKPPFQLPAAIEATGICEMRGAAADADDGKKLKHKTRDRLVPKMGRLEIDYHILHDAFFRWEAVGEAWRGEGGASLRAADQPPSPPRLSHAVKPPLTGPGDLYYEGKEFETRVDAAPGVLSAALRDALGMADGAPPPWLINMQRYGPPPSYPSLKIPGLNAPTPPGASYGYHAGGWGKPPVDAAGRGLYGDVFGLARGAASDDEGAPVDKKARWGELEPEPEEEEASDAGEASDADEAAADDGAVSMAPTDVSGLTSVAPAPGLDLRKGGGGDGGPAPRPTPAGPLYTVLESAPAALGAGIMGSDHTYVMPSAAAAAAAAPRSAATKALDALAGKGPAGAAPRDVEVALDPDEIAGLDAGAVAAMYAARRESATAAARDEGVDALLAARAAKRPAAAKKGKKDEIKF